MENLQLFNESNDHKYFTIIPNFILNHSTAVAQALYLQLKRLAGDNGAAYPGSRYLMEKLGISHPTLKKEFKYLLEKGWIKEIGERSIQTDGGRQKVKAYKVVDLWQLNAEYYAKQGGEKIATPCSRGEKIATQGVKSGGEKIATKEDPCIKNQNTKEDINTSNASVAVRDDQDIIDIIDAFKIVNLSYGKYFGNTTQRAAAARMAKIHGKEKVIQVISTLEISNKQKFCPHIYTACQLEDKWNKLQDSFANIKAEEKKPFYKGMPMRQFDGRWKVLCQGEWKEYADKESLIEFK